MSNMGTIALFVGVAIAGVIVWEIRRAPPRVELAAALTQPLNREQPLLSVTEAHRMSDRQQPNKYFLQNWRDRSTRPYLN